VCRFGAKCGTASCKFSHPPPPADIDSNGGGERGQGEGGGGEGAITVAQLVAIGVTDPAEQAELLGYDPRDTANLPRNQSASSGAAAAHAPAQNVSMCTHT